VNTGELSVTVARRCIHCKHFAPEYEKAAKRLKENDPPIVLAKVDAIVETQLATRYKLQNIMFVSATFCGPRYSLGYISCYCISRVLIFFPVSQ